ncbi:hypothetical protein H8D51_00790 [bacterium]|nr:hypothetical protein [bacterium]
MSPERLLRPNFRNAMNALNALDVFINYAVIDEAHCVSMWGHDFRPSYLSLDRNFKKFCTFQGHVPVTVALTGTASQLVLIDLKRELNISDMEAIVRPKTFDRPELSFSIIPCHNDEKYQVLQSVLRTLADRLGIPSAPENAWGIIYAYRPRELWELLGRFVGDANEHVQAVLTATGLHGIRFGVYCGKKPTGTTFSPREWGKYKAKTLAAFKRGDIRMLFGNAAVGVGIDNEKLNYIINYRMPQSIEAYYQQCGRAGRSGQPSPCFLIFSDNNPRATQQWLNGEIIEMDDRWDDLGTVSFFHRQSFPGREPDSNGALGVFMAIFDAGEPENGRAIINQIDDRTEHYLSYWLVLGVIEDYEVTGMADTTRYHVKLHQVIEEFMIHPNKSALQEHLLRSLYSYMSRYRPYTIEEVRTTFENQGEGGQLSERIIRTLIDFIYDRIAYQRREAIRTMVDFCNQEDTSPERLRQIIKSYFDESEKFTEILNKMAESKPAPDLVSRILKQVEGFDDVEHLYWETRRLLDERSRPDWALVNLYAMLFRERFFNDTCRKLLASAIEEMTDDTSLNDLAIESLLAVPLSFLVALEENGTSEPSAVIEILSHLYENYSTRFTGVISALSESEELVGFYSLALANKQIERVIYAARFEQIA